ncbi:Uu.00g070820.m01.CDS01 [Anthostomella pinea]|uniref:Uu.00g070820.m01.CDS01 n=1 Tax=Anthostomella pinea TaxID=933095 RepID=A0AAI8VUR3_9PEZI|nr:Uu.00g070820.m01.CDS01 [Anthostomella pinea]
MEPGTILAVVQLVSSVIKLSRHITFEFFGPDTAPGKLRALNERLQSFNTLLGDILKDPRAPDKLSRAAYPDSISVLKTLKEF